MTNTATTATLTKVSQTKKRTIAVSEIKEKLRKAYRSLDNPLFDECLESIPFIPASAMCYFTNGDKRCCVFGDFRNLQVDPIGFGNTDDEAYQDLRKQIK